MADISGAIAPCLTSGPANGEASTSGISPATNPTTVQHIHTATADGDGYGYGYGDGDGDGDGW